MLKMVRLFKSSIIMFIELARVVYVSCFINVTYIFLCIVPFFFFLAIETKRTSELGSILRRIL